jgi:hypothetical protein
MGDKVDVLREIAHLERIAADQLEEIIRIQTILTAEQEKNDALFSADR